MKVNEIIKLELDFTKNSVTDIFTMEDISENIQVKIPNIYICERLVKFNNVLKGSIAIGCQTIKKSVLKAIILQLEGTPLTEKVEKLYLIKTGRDKALGLKEDLVDSSEKYYIFRNKKAILKEGTVWKVTNKISKPLTKNYYSDRLSYKGHFTDISIDTKGRIKVNDKYKRDIEKLKKIYKIIEVIENYVSTRGLS